MAEDVANKNIVWCDEWSFPDGVRLWIQRASVDDVGCLREKCSPLFLSKGLILAGSIETLSDRLNESFHDAILMTCVRYVLLPFEITGEFFT